MRHLCFLCPLASILALGCGKEKTEAPTPPVVSRPVAVRAPAADLGDSLHKENAELRSEVASLRAQVEALTKTNASWKEWSEKQAQTSRTAPTAAPPSRPATKVPNVAELCMDDLKIGQIGPIQVQSGNKNRPTVTVDEVVSKDQFIAGWGRKIYLIRGMPTQGLVDGHKLELSGIFEVSSTKLRSGTTVFVLTFLPH